MKSDKDAHILIYSDCVDTQVLRFDPKELKVNKLSKKICHQNQIEMLPAAKWIDLYEDEY